MTVHEQHGLLVFLDCVPSEQLNLQNDRKLSVVAVVCDEDDGVPQLVRGYKSVGRGARMQRIHALRAFIESSNSIHAVGLCGRESFVANWACDSANDAVPGIGATWTSDAKTLEWRGHRYPRAQALGLAFYASVLPLIGLRVAQWLEGMHNVHRACFVLDMLPFEHDGHSMDLLRALSVTGRNAQMWRENRAVGSCDFEFANLAKYERPGLGFKVGKSHPHFVLADWLAAALNANHDPGYYDGTQGGNLRRSGVQDLAGVWTTLRDRKLAAEFDLELLYRRMAGEKAAARRKRVATRAYYLWLNRRGRDWRDPDSNWLEAEQAEDPVDQG